MPLPDALVIGPQRAGTTWIHYYLAAHGEVALPAGVKETMFFDRRYSRGIAWYASHFTKGTAKRRIVEVAPTYFQHADAPARIQETLGQIQLLVTLRNPVYRTFSHYLHLRRYGFTTLDFMPAMVEHPEILDSSCYARHLKRWQAFFEPEKIKTFFQEDLETDAPGYAARLCESLDISFRPVPENLRRKVNIATLPAHPGLAKLGQYLADGLRSLRLYAPIEAAKTLGLKRIFFGRPGSRALPKLQDHERQRLLDYFLPGIIELESMINRDLSQWKSI